MWNPSILKCSSWMNLLKAFKFTTGRTPSSFLGTRNNWETKLTWWGSCKLTAPFWINVCISAEIKLCCSTENTISAGATNCMWVILSSRKKPVRSVIPTSPVLSGPSCECLIYPAWTGATIPFHKENSIVSSQFYLTISVRWQTTLIFIQCIRTERFSNCFCILGSVLGCLILFELLWCLGKAGISRGRFCNPPCSCLLGSRGGSRKNVLDVFLLASGRISS